MRLSTSPSAALEGWLDFFYAPLRAGRLSFDGTGGATAERNCRDGTRMFSNEIRTVVVVGAQWGDEGKGKLVDVIAERADWVVRYWAAWR